MEDDVDSQQRIEHNMLESRNWAKYNKANSEEDRKNDIPPKKRLYRCSICRSPEHTAPNCPRQRLTKGKTRTCRSCGLSGRVYASEDKSKNSLECHAEAPIPGEDGVRVFPLVKPNDWCDAWRERER